MLLPENLTGKSPRTTECWLRKTRRRVARERWFYYMDNYDPAVADFMEEKIDRLIGEIR